MPATSKEPNRTSENSASDPPATGGTARIVSEDGEEADEDSPE